jgi:hypothetical protein
MRLHDNWGRLSPALLLAALFTGPIPARADGTQPDAHVLSVGIDTYARANPLRGCVNDARAVTAQFLGQQGKQFGKVTAKTLTNGEATRDAIAEELERLGGSARAGDFVVLFLSGHGARSPRGGWHFLPHDYNPRAQADGALTDREILARADALAGRGAKVLLIIDACHAGQLRHSARASLNRYRDAKGGGLVLMVSSMPSQLSHALGEYSAFARAVVEALAGEADIDGDGHVTLKELRRYAYDRTYQLLRQKGIAAEQDGECDWSLSISDSMKLAVAGPRVAERDPVPPAERVLPKDRVPPDAGRVPPVGKRPGALAGTEWAGNEELKGYGKLRFEFRAGSRVLMVDAAGSVEGTWSRKGDRVTLWFYDGRVVYTGTLGDGALSGTARNQRTSWEWNVTLRRPSTVTFQPELN